MKLMKLNPFYTINMLYDIGIKPLQTYVQGSLGEYTFESINPNEVLVLQYTRNSTGGIIEKFGSCEATKDDDVQFYQMKYQTKEYFMIHIMHNILGSWKRYVLYGNP